MAGGAGALLAGGNEASATGSAAGSVPFLGEHQAGITTPAQDRLHFVAFDVVTKDRDRLVAHAPGVDRRRGPDDRRARTPG